jgi:hypothetical protein
MLFGHQKYHRRRRITCPAWIFGMADASPGGAVMMTEVAGRATEDLVALIWAWATPGAHVNTDGLPSYQLVGDLGFEHGVVEHVDHFVNPGDNAHTQRIESMWWQLGD